MTGGAKAGLLWDFFLKSAERKNSAHYWASCRACCDAGYAAVGEVAVVTPRSRSAFTYNVQDVSADRKTGEAVAVLIHEQIRLLKDRYSSKVVAIVSDAAGEAAKARRLVQAALPYIIILNCFSHQTNLMVADYFKKTTGREHDYQAKVALGDSSDDVVDQSLSSLWHAQ
ncbi:hypothetical protein WJX77_005556 [Trebouxia sp. C0004]